MLGRTFVGLITFVILTAACSHSEDPGSNNGAILGTYNLVSINSLPVPVTVSLTNTTKIEITASVLTLSSASFANATTYRTTEGGQVRSATESCSGTYSVTGLSIAFAEVTAQNTTCGSRYTGAWDGANRISVDFDPTTHAIFSR